MGDCVSKSGHIMGLTLRPKKCRRESRFSERTHRKMAILSLYSVILSLRGCLIYERHVRRSGFHRAPHPVHPSLGSTLHPLLRVVFLTMQGTVAASASHRTCRPPGVEAVPRGADVPDSRRHGAHDGVARRLSLSV